MERCLLINKQSKFDKLICGHALQQERSFSPYAQTSYFFNSCPKPFFVFFLFQARHIVQVSVRAPLAKQAVIQAAVHPRLHRIKCNIRHRRSTVSLRLSTPAKTHGNVQSPAPGTSTFAPHTALPVAATPKEEHASKYINFNLKSSVFFNFTLTLSSCNWRKPHTYLSKLHLALLRNSVTD